MNIAILLFQCCLNHYAAFLVKKIFPNAHLIPEDKRIESKLQEYGLCPHCERRRVMCVFVHSCDRIVEPCCELGFPTRNKRHVNVRKEITTARQDDIAGARAVDSATVNGRRRREPSELTVSFRRISALICTENEVRKPSRVCSRTFSDMLKWLIASNK